MILTEPQKKAAYEMVANDWRASAWLTQPEQHTLVDICERQFEQHIKGTHNWRADDYWRNRSQMVASAKQELKGFISIGFILMVVIGWIISKILDWIYERYVLNTTSPQLQ